MKRKVVVVLLLVMTLVFSLVGVENGQAAGNIYTITPEIGVNLRAEPMQEGATVAKLKQGYRVEELEKSGEWIKVSYEGKQGYVKSEYLKPLDIDLVAAYKHYATILEGEFGDVYYSLLYDFTQDGLEELYIVEHLEQGFRHRMFSGQKELFDETLQEGLYIYWDDYNHYIVTDTSEDTGRVELFELSEIGISSQPGFLRGEMIKTDVNIIRSGNLSLSKTAALGEYILVHGEFDDIENYSVEGKKVTKEQWDKVVSGYQNAPNYLGLFSYDGRHGFESSPINDESNFHETLDKLLALYEKYNDSPTELLLEETEIGEIESYTNYMLQSESPLNNVKNSEIDYYELLNMALYYAMEIGELYDEEEYTYKYPKLTVDEWMYNNFGVKIDTQKLKDHTLRYETEYGTGSAKPIEIQDEYYIAPGSGDVGIGNEPYIINSHQLEDDFIALEYVHGYTKALSVLTTEPDYILVKKVEAADGKTYYPYINTVQTLENIDYDTLNNYAEKLDVVKDHKKVEQVEEPVDKQTEEPLVKESKGQGKTTNIVLYLLVIAGGLVVAAVVVMDVRKRRSGGRIKKSTTIIAIIFAVIAVGAVIFITINPSQSQPESDTYLGDGTQEDSSLIAEDEQESNDLEEERVDPLEPEITDVSDEDAARTFYNDFRNDYQNALNTGDFDLVSNYFEDGSAVKQNYKDFVLNHLDWNFDYSYTFLSSTTELVEATSPTTIVVTAHEIFDLDKQDSNPKITKNERKRNYTLKLIGDSFYISNIENLDN